MRFQRGFLMSVWGRYYPTAIRVGTYEIHMNSHAFKRNPRASTSTTHELNSNRRSHMVTHANQLSSAAYKMFPNATHTSIYARTKELTSVT